MLEQGNWGAGPGEDASRAPLLLDLAHIDLRALRAMDDPRLDAEVERVLSGLGDLGEAWWSGSDPDNHAPHGLAHRTIPATGDRPGDSEQAG